MYFLLLLVTIETILVICLLHHVSFLNKQMIKQNKVIQGILDILGGVYNAISDKYKLQ